MNREQIDAYQTLTMPQLRERLCINQRTLRAMVLDGRIRLCQGTPADDSRLWRVGPAELIRLCGGPIDPSHIAPIDPEEEDQ